MHSAVQSPENLNIVKYLLSHDVCKPMLLSLGRNGQQQSSFILPLDLAKEQLVNKSKYRVREVVMGMYVNVNTG